MKRVKLITKFKNHWSRYIQNSNLFLKALKSALIKTRLFRMKIDIFVLLKLDGTKAYGIGKRTSTINWPARK